MNKKIVIIGAGGHGQVVADILIQMRHSGLPVEFSGFLDGNPALHDQIYLGYRVFGSESLLATIDHDAIIVAIGDNATRKKVCQTMLLQGEHFFSAVHPNAVMGSGVQIGQGCMICAGVVINTQSSIADHVILNTGCTIDHHNNIGDYVHVAPGCHTGGEVTIAEGTLIGLGASVLPRKRIGAWAIIGGGATVTKDLPDKVLAYGVPCQVINEIH
jgi:sugar O-acyltransferase (sialic acid O-acetyltransferase NeuD family)